MSEMDERRLESVITGVLEQRPGVHVPEDFAARVSARVAASGPSVRVRRAVRPRFSVARAAAMVAMVALTIALFVLAPHVQMNGFSLSLGIEMLLLVELAGIGYGLMRLRENGL